MKHNHHRPALRIVHRARSADNQQRASVQAISSMVRQLRVHRADVGKCDRLLALIERECATMSKAQFDPTPWPMASAPKAMGKSPNTHPVPSMEEIVEESSASTVRLFGKPHKWTRFITEERIGSAEIYLHPLYPMARFRVLATDGIRAYIQHYDAPTSTPILAHCTNLTIETTEVDEEARAARLQQARASRPRKTPTYDINELI